MTTLVQKTWIFTLVYAKQQCATGQLCNSAQDKTSIFSQNVKII